MERRRNQELKNLKRSEYYLKFKQKYQDIIKPCFDQFKKLFENNGHVLVLKYENLDEMYVQPEVKYDLLVKGNEGDIVQIYIFGKGINENILFYLKMKNNIYKESFQFEQISPKAIEKVLVKALSMPI